MLESLVFPVVRHAEHPDSGLLQLMSFAEHHELGHEGDVDGLPVEFGGHLGGLGDVAAVHEPEAGRDGGGEADAVVDEGEWGGAGDVFPLCTGCPACKYTRSDHKKSIFFFVFGETKNCIRFPNSSVIIFQLHISKASKNALLIYWIWLS